MGKKVFITILLLFTIVVCSLSVAFAAQDKNGFEFDSSVMPYSNAYRFYHLVADDAPVDLGLERMLYSEAAKSIGYDLYKGWFSYDYIIIAAFETSSGELKLVDTPDNTNHWYDTFNKQGFTDPEDYYELDTGFVVSGMVPDNDKSEKKEADSISTPDYDEFFKEQEEFLNYIGYKGSDLDDLKDSFEEYNIHILDEEDAAEFEGYGMPDPQTVIRDFPNPHEKSEDGCQIYVFEDDHECQAYAMAYIIAVHDRTGFEPTRVKGDLKIAKNTLVVISRVEGKPAMALFMFDFDIPE